MNQKFANPSALGYAGFAITLWMVSMINAGWFGANPSHNMDLMLAVTFGGTAMAIAGLLEYFRGRTLDMLLFLSFGAFWWAWALHTHATGTAAMPATAGGYMGWFFVLWAVVAFYIWIASFRDGTARILFSLGLWLSMLALAVADWSGANGFTIVAGYLGLITAIIGGYISAADVINVSYERVILPTGESKNPFTQTSDAEVARAQDHDITHPAHA